MGRGPNDTVGRFRDKLDRELKSGMITILLLEVIRRRGPLHGYGILRTVRDASGGDLSFKEGTAYPLLNKLETSGLISAFWGAGDGGPPRKYYQLTDVGAEVIDHALGDWDALNQTVGATLDRLGDERNKPRRKKA